MKPQHTPGEWTVEENVDHYPFIMGYDNNVIAKLFDDKDGSLFYGRTKEETKANAALISAAPDLKIALETALTIIDRLCEEYSSAAKKHANFTNGEYATLKEALNKAEGK